MKDKKIIDKLLNDIDFRKIVNDDVGVLLAPVLVDWENNKIIFIGEKASKEIFIDATLATIKGEFQ